MTDIEKLLRIMKDLRDPNSGCPWDIKQNFVTIAPYTIEEAYEVADAIERNDMADLRDELGDLLFQVVFHAQMADELGEFNFDQVVEAICDKMERRHPHVFGDDVIDNAEQQTIAWEEYKAQERSQKSKDSASKSTPESVLDGVSVAMPALTRAEKIQRRAARVGFDWPEISPVLDKIEEELNEVKSEIEQQGTQDKVKLEIGDLLFAVVNLARHANVDCESALRSSTAKFENRFRQVELTAQEQYQNINSCNLEKLEEIYQQVKRQESENP